MSTSKSMDDIRASVVIPAYGSRDTIGMVLDVLQEQETQLAYEVIVVESSGDGTAELVRKIFPWVRLIASEERLYPGASRNRGAEEAKGELLLFLDSDCVPGRTWIQDMWDAHQKWDCAAVAGAILNGNPELSVSISSYMNEFSDFFPYGQPRYKHYLPSGNLSYKMEVFRRHGGFDSSEPMYEDLIFNTLLARSGEKLLFHPGIGAAHHHRNRLGEYLAHEFRRGKGAAVARRMGLIVGVSWTKYPVLAFFAAPGLFARKATVFPMRMLRAYPSYALRVIRALPCFYLALLVWHVGFLSDIVHNRTSTNVRERASECTVK